MQMNDARLIAKELQFSHLLTGSPVFFHGDSMLPFLRDGDALSVTPIAWPQIAVGDILVYRLEEKFPTLRVVRKAPRKVTLIADNWPGRRFDAWRDDVLGKVTARTRDGATLTEQSPWWRVQAQFVVWRYRLGCRVARLNTVARHALTRLRPLRGAPYHQPPNLQVNVSSQCNLTCRMCPYLAVHQDTNHLKFMTREAFIRLLPVIRQIGAVHLSGAGEPFFNPLLFDFIEQVRREAPRVTIDLTTNGSLLTEERARKLVELGVHKVHVSFDGLPTSVEKIRVRINGERVIDNIRRLTALKRELASTRPIVQINYMTGYGTYRDLIDFVKLGREIGVNEIQLLEMQPASAADAADNLFHGLGADNGKTLKSAIMLAQHAGIQLHMPRVTQDACYYPFNPHIGEDGEVYPCCYLDYDGRQLFSDGVETRMPRVSFGNLARQSFAQIWASPAYQEFRQRTATGKFTPYCRSCYDVRRLTAQRVNDVLGE